MLVWGRFDWKFFRSVLIHVMNLGLKLKSLNVFSINSKAMLSKALEKSIWSMIPGKLCVLAC